MEVEIKKITCYPLKDEAFILFERGKFSTPILVLSRHEMDSIVDEFNVIKGRRDSKT
jgi:hypothetical protein